MFTVKVKLFKSLEHTESTVVILAVGYEERKLFLSTCCLLYCLQVTPRARLSSKDSKLPQQHHVLTGKLFSTEHRVA